MIESSAAAFLSFSSVLVLFLQFLFCALIFIIYLLYFTFFLVLLVGKWWRVREGWEYTSCLKLRCLNR